MATALERSRIAGLMDAALAGTSSIRSSRALERNRIAGLMDAVCMTAGSEAENDVRRAAVHGGPVERLPAIGGSGRDHAGRH